MIPYFLYEDPDRFDLLSAKSHLFTMVPRLSVLLEQGGRLVTYLGETANQKALR
jgi:hypothetical protein